MPDELRKDDKDRLISLSQAAEMYGFNPVYLGELARKGRLRAQKVGASWVTTPAAVEEYVHSRKKKGVYRRDIQTD